MKIQWQVRETGVSTTAARHSRLKSSMTQSTNCALVDLKVTHCQPPSGLDRTTNPAYTPPVRGVCQPDPLPVPLPRLLHRITDRAKIKKTVT